MGFVYIGLGAYLTAIGFKGNTQAFLTELKNSRSFLLWLPIVIVLWAGYQWDRTRPFVAPLAGLTLLAFILQTEPQVAKESKAVLALISPPAKKGRAK